MKTLPLLYCTLVALTFAGCRNNNYTDSSVTASNKIVDVTIHTVRSEPYTEFSRYNGRIIPINDVKLICYNGGRVEALRVKEGENVKAGASLAAIDSAKAIIQLKTARLQEKIASMNLQQTRKHLKDGNASPLALDKAELELLIARNARIEAQKNYRGALAITPISGTIIHCPISLYNELAPGSPTFTVAQTGTMIAEFSIVESDVPLITIGCEATVTSSLYPDQSWSGVVRSIAREASDHAFNAQVHLTNTDGLLKSGATAMVKIKLRHYDDAIRIPTRCIITEGTDRSVMVITTDNRAVHRIITIGSQSDSLTYVKSGLKNGDRVIITRYDLMRSGLQVRIIN